MKEVLEKIEHIVKPIKREIKKYACEILCDYVSDKKVKQ